MRFQPTKSGDEEDEGKDRRVETVALLEWVAAGERGVDWIFFEL